MRLISLLGVPTVVAALLASGCGGDDAGDAAPGSKERPMVATTQAMAVPKSAESKSGRVNESADKSGSKASAKAPQAAVGSSPATGGGESGSGADAKPGYQSLLGQKGSPKGSRFTPCNLVSQSRAAAILGSPVQRPLEAPQGPTCIYRTESGKAFVTVAVQGTSLAKLKKQLQKPQAVTVAGRAGYCGQLGQPVLYLPVGERKLLTVAAPCAVAKAFAATAVQRLAS